MQVTESFLWFKTKCTCLDQKSSSNVMDYDFLHSSHIIIFIGFMILIVYVNKILISRNFVAIIHNVISFADNGLFLGQRKYGLDLLHETGMTSCKVNVPMDLFLLLASR